MGSPSTLLMIHRLHVHRYYYLEPMNLSHIMLPHSCSGELGPTHIHTYMHVVSPSYTHLVTIRLGHLVDPTQSKFSETYCKYLVA